MRNCWKVGTRDVEPTSTVETQKSLAVRATSTKLNQINSHQVKITRKYLRDSIGTWRQDLET
jgi:hypothetical protein